MHAAKTPRGAVIATHPIKALAPGAAGPTHPVIVVAGPRTPAPAAEPRALSPSWWRAPAPVIPFGYWLALGAAFGLALLGAVLALTAAEPACSSNPAGVVTPTPYGPPPLR